jgi:hypothetical protein
MKRNTRTPSTGIFYLVQFEENGDTLWTGRKWTTDEDKAKRFENEADAWAYGRKRFGRKDGVFVVEKFGSYADDLTKGQIGVLQAA